ncbi:MAG: hypothetical protein GX339_08230 [Tissierellia bacterium]|nr:hypothetical protein [Tissierellia bacterium]
MERQPFFEQIYSEQKFTHKYIIYANATSGPTSVRCGETSGEECSTHVCGEENELNRKSPFNFYIKGRRVDRQDI